MLRVGLVAASQGVWRFLWYYCRGRETSKTHFCLLINILLLLIWFSRLIASRHWSQTGIKFSGSACRRINRGWTEIASRLNLLRSWTYLKGGIEHRITAKVIYVWKYLGHCVSQWIKIIHFKIELKTVVYVSCLVIIVIIIQENDDFAKLIVWENVKRFF
jgi:hypothetical protein